MTKYRARLRFETAEQDSDTLPRLTDTACDEAECCRCAFGGRRFTSLRFGSTGCLAQQLEARLGQPLRDACCRAPNASALARLAAVCGMTQARFGDVIHHPWPPVEFLRAIKGYAKQRHLVADERGRKAVLVAVYLACIAAARLTAKVWISSKCDSELAADFRWLVRQPWVDEPTRQLARRSLQGLMHASQIVESSGTSSS